MKGYVKWPDIIQNIHIHLKDVWQISKVLKTAFKSVIFLEAELTPHFFLWVNTAWKKKLENTAHFPELSDIYENWNASKSEWKQSDFHNKIAQQM